MRTMRVEEWAAGALVAAYDVELPPDADDPDPAPAPADATGGGILSRLLGIFRPSASE